MYSYCLFCATMKCDSIASAIRQRFGYAAFSPKIVQRRWIRGECHEEIKPYLPGYVFVCTQEPIGDFREIQRMEGVGRYLGSSQNGYRLEGNDRGFAEMLYSHGGTIGIMKVFQEGDRVRLSEEALGRFEAEIIRLDRRKGRAQLQYCFDGNSYKVWMGYEMIENAGPRTPTPLPGK